MSSHFRLGSISFPRPTLDPDFAKLRVTYKGVETKKKKRFYCRSVEVDD